MEERLAGSCFDRKIHDFVRKGRFFCLLCEKKDTTYSRVGYAQHVKAAHEGEVKHTNRLLEECLSGMKHLANEEALEMIDCLSAQNRESGECVQLTVSSESLENDVVVWASDHASACQMVCILLDEQGKVPVQSDGPLKVTVQNEREIVKFHCTKDSQGFSTIPVWLKTQVKPVPRAPVALLEDLSQSPSYGVTPSDAEDPLLSVLQTAFGFDSFREGQHEVIDKVLSKQDGLILLPTGGGKTLCFSLPAAVSMGISIVVLPTLSLMQDLYSRLREVISTVCLSGSTAVAERDNIFRTLSSPACAVKLLLVTPELLSDRNVQSSLLKCDISRFVIDEAHCIDEWGHQFRPSYLALSSLKQKFDVQIVCFTATATDHTVMTIKSVLQLKDPFTYKRSVKRPNLTLNIRQKKSFKHVSEVILKILQNDLSDKSVIIYCLLPRECLDFCAFLLKHGISCVSYHGDLLPEEKIDNLNKWQKNEVRVIVATKSLGMGIDKSDVRSVIHASFPNSIHEYYQQVGRAGRDGNLSECYLFFKFSDRTMHLNNIRNMTDETLAHNALKQLNLMLKLSLSHLCIVGQLLKYYGEIQDDYNCGACSKCVNSNESKDVTGEAKHALLVLQGLIANVQNVSISLLAKVLKGSTDKDVLKKNLNVTIPLYGCCKHLTLSNIESILETMFIHNIINESGRSLMPGELADQVLNNSLKVKCVSI